MKKTISSREKIFNFSWLLRLIIRSPTRSISNIYFEEYIPDNSDVTILAKIPKDVK